MEFEWDEDKADRNLVKHGFNFRVAEQVFENRVELSRCGRRSVMKEGRIITYTPGDGTKDTIDWARIDAMTEEEIDRNADEDPDNPPWTEYELRNARLVMPNGEVKIPVSIRLDGEVIQYFKEQGPGYQSRISSALLTYVRARKEELDTKTQRAIGGTTRNKPAKTTQAQKPPKKKTTANQKSATKRSASPTKKTSTRKSK